MVKTAIQGCLTIKDELVSLQKRELPIHVVLIWSLIVCVVPPTCVFALLSYGDSNILVEASKPVNTNDSSAQFVNVIDSLNWEHVDGENLFLVAPSQEHLYERLLQADSPIFRDKVPNAETHAIENSDPQAVEFEGEVFTNNVQPVASVDDLESERSPQQPSTDLRKTSEAAAIKPADDNFGILMRRSPNGPFDLDLCEHILATQQQTPLGLQQQKTAFLNDPATQHAIDANGFKTIDRNDNTLNR